ncbi:HPr family phosphocarrier protein [Alkalibacter saccharofermentans]|uniref:Phosphocarrier protein HPr n=1 Tax=Alkalibacter saccharofermentans DSM 14828 TaxID=1120975 RepID=A0A1M4VHW9_9FIRM|nr:HPr family phosphocarrier protein [Alkalibacter saccharofermentans]SHE68445.1 phosphocarrier protein [Alkalibacter saccharofermentans DSM 14828]
MVCKSVVVTNKLGLHARPASKFVELANRFKSDIYIKKDTATVSAKSIMGVMVLGVDKGTEIIIEASGSDEEEALNALCALVESEFEG